jgi:hypothetical protein
MELVVMNNELELMKDTEGSGRGLISGTIKAFACRNGGNLRKTSETIAGLRELCIGYSVTLVFKMILRQCTG